jgi:hypothetical protein
VIEMAMRYEDVDVVYFLVFGQFDSEWPQSGARIEDDDMVTTTNLDAWCVAAITDRCWPGTRNASSDSPEPNPH